MSDPALVLFDDGCDLSPLTDLRASFELRSGAATTLERIARQAGGQPAGLLTPPALAALVAERFGLPVNQLPDAGSILLVNGRCSSLPPQTHELPMNAAIIDEHGVLVAAYLDHVNAETWADRRTLPDAVSRRAVAVELISLPWQLLAHVAANLPGDLAVFDFPSPAVATLGDHRVRAAASAHITPMTMFDVSAGDIVIDDGAAVEPFALLHGPCYIGPHTTIVAHAHIRPMTVIGPHCKVGGEISASVIHGYSNKSHFGYLGNSIVGQWVNLGAGTTTSNLKNTYGPVAMQTQPDAPVINTAMQSLGSILGDHVKTAIGTRLNTGSCISTGAMIACSMFPPKFVERFAFLTDTGTPRYDLRKFQTVADRMMQRRGLRLAQNEADRLAQLYAMVRA